MSKEQAQAAKARGNAAFTSGDFTTAVKEFTIAIENDPSDHVFYSNRSGAYASLQQYDKALEDADKCIQLKPDFVKGYSRKGLALHQLKRIDEAKTVYEAGLKLDPSNAALKEGLEEAEKAMKNPFGEMFGPSMWGKLMTDPVTREYLKDQAFVDKLKQLEKNPQLMGTFLSDKKVSAALGVILGLGPAGFQASGAPGEDFDANMEDTESDTRSAPTSTPKPTPTPQPQPQPTKPTPQPQTTKTQTPEEKAAADKKSEATKFKDAGNELYKKRKFAEAIEQYNKAQEIEPHNIVYYNNIAAAHFEAKELDKSIETSKQAIEIGREHNADYKDIAKAWARLGAAYGAQGKLEDAIQAYNKSLIEDQNDKVKQSLRKILDEKKKRDENAYIDPKKSEEAKERGNAYFKEGKWVDAINEYTEALKRDPSNYKIYSNRAGCYTKLMDWQRALEDCDKCIQMDSSFVKAYIRKAKVQHFLKQYHKALDTYDTGLKLDPNATELIEGRRQTMMAINNEKGDPERAKEAMKDPEIQSILRDPIINKVLSDLQQSPAAAQGALADPDIRAKIEKLIAAGILQVGK